MNSRSGQDSHLLSEVIQRLGLRLGIPSELTLVERGLRAAQSSGLPEAAEPAKVLEVAARQLGIQLAPTDLTSGDAWTLLADGFPVLVDVGNQGWCLLEKKSGWWLEAYDFHAGRIVTLTRRQLRRLWAGAKLRRCLIAQAALNSRISTAHAGASSHQGAGMGTAHGSVQHGNQHGHAAHPRPLKRLLALMRLEARDLWTVALFALVGGVLSLATPLAVESLVNTVAWGTYLQPLFVLSLLLFACLGFAGMLKLLQIIVAEVLQRRLFVRIVGDLAHRFPLVQRSAVEGSDPGELANRYFDIMTIQKAAASLVLDGISIILQTTIGLVLLAFYHPFLLGFDIVLLLLMTVFTYALGRGGVRTAIEESRVKYRVAHWLQDVIALPTAFRLHGGFDYAVDHTNRLTVEYLVSRRQHFQVLLRQNAFSLVLLAIASTALLGVGGWLVIRGELTLGQLVASELVVTAIVSAFAKVGKSLESFYDLLAAMDKVGHLLDLPADPPGTDVSAEGLNGRVRWQGLGIAFRGLDPAVITTIEPGTRLAISGASASGKTRLLEILAGLREPDHGFADISGIDVREASRVADGRLVGIARQPEIFCGSLLENVRLGRSWLTNTDVRIALERVGLWDTVLAGAGGLDASLQSGGYPLSYSQCVRLMLARALVAQPQVLLIDGTLDLLAPQERFSLWQHLIGDSSARTIIIATHDAQIMAACDRNIECADAVNHQAH